MSAGTSFQHSLSVLDNFKDVLLLSNSASVPKKDVQKALEALEYVGLVYSSPHSMQKLHIEASANLSNLVQTLKNAVEHGVFEIVGQQSLVAASIERVESALKRFGRKGKKVASIGSDAFFKR